MKQAKVISVESRNFSDNNGNSYWDIKLDDGTEGYAAFKGNNPWATEGTTVFWEWKDQQKGRLTLKKEDPDQQQKPQQSAPRQGRKQDTNRLVYELGKQLATMPMSYAKDIVAAWATSNPGALQKFKDNDSALAYMEEKTLSLAKSFSNFATSSFVDVVKTLKSGS